MSLVKFLVRYSWRIVLAAILAGVVSGASSTVLLAVVNNSLAEPRPALWWSFLGLALLVPFSRIVSELLLIRLGQVTILDLRIRLSRQIVSLPLRKLEELGAHRLLNVLINDIAAISNVVGLIPVLCINISIIIGCLIYLGWLSVKLLVMILGFTATGVVAYQLPVAKASGYLHRAREEGNRLLDHFQGIIKGAKELRLHNGRRGAFFSDLLTVTARAIKSYNTSGLKIYTVASSSGLLMVFAILGIILFVYPFYFEADSAVVTGYTLVVLYMMGPFQTAMNSMPVINQANVAIKHVEELGVELEAYATEPASAPLAALEAAASRNPASHGWDGIELVGVTHSYASEEEDRPFVLGPIDFKLRPGEIVFIAGGNGSGKTTLAKLLTGLYAPDAGEIYIDGVAVNDENRNAYCQCFSAVFSDFFLFEKLLGLDAPDLEAQTRRVLERMQLERKVTVEDGTFSTLDLSQGQRKRLALLTVFLEDRPIYVFDEWAADQDPVFRNIFYHEILPELKARGKAVLVISHDERYFSCGDRLVRLEYGKIETETAPLAPDHGGRRPEAN